MEVSINLVSVLVATVVYFVFGWIWYGPLFGKTWQGLMGFTPESMQNMKITATKAMVLGFISHFVMAYVLAHFMAIVGVSTVGEAFEFVFWLWLGFMAMVGLGSYLWEGKPLKLFLLNTLQLLVGTFLMAVVLVMM